MSRHGKHNGQTAASGRRHPAIEAAAIGAGSGLANSTGFEANTDNASPSISVTAASSSSSLSLSSSSSSSSYRNLPSFSSSITFVSWPDITTSVVLQITTLSNGFSSGQGWSELPLALFDRVRSYISSPVFDHLVRLPAVNRSWRQLVNGDARGLYDCWRHPDTLSRYPEKQHLVLLRSAFKVPVPQ